MSLKITTVSSEYHLITFILEIKSQITREKKKHKLYISLHQVKLIGPGRGSI